MMRPLLLALSLTAPITLHAQRKQVEVTVAGAPATTATRVQTIYADAQYAIERVEPTLIAAEVPLKRRDWGGRAGTRAVIQATLLPAGADSTRVVLTGRILVPEASSLPAQTIAVSDKKHPEYGKTNAQAWAAMQHVAAELGGLPAQPQR